MYQNEQESKRMNNIKEKKEIGIILDKAEQPSKTQNPLI
jgi:hypothetical protein